MKIKHILVYLGWAVLFFFAYLGSLHVGYWITDTITIHNQNNHAPNVVTSLDNECLAYTQALGRSITLRECLELRRARK